VKKIIRNITMLEKQPKIPVANGNQCSRALDNPPAKNVDRPVKRNNFARILQGETGIGTQKLKAILKVT
jgi:hypothetical protein